MINHFKSRFRVCQSCVLIQATEDVFNIHNRIINQFSHRDRQPTQGHDIDRDAEPIENQSRDHDRQGNGGQRDKRRPKIHQKQE